MPKPLEIIFNLLLAVIAIYAITSSILVLFGYQFFTFPIKIEVIQNLSFDYVRLLLLRSCVFLTMAIFLLNYALYKRPYSALAPVVVFCYSLSFFEFISQFTLQNTTEYSSNAFAMVFWLFVGVLTHYKNQKNAQTIFRN